MEHLVFVQLNKILKYVKILSSFADVIFPRLDGRASYSTPVATSSNQCAMSTYEAFGIYTI